MQCEETELWTFRGLVGAFVDLGIAYFLLCASALAFFASKFLALFGLCLPCPCNGFFREPNRSNCWQRVLVDSPSEKISSVQFSVRSRFPFDSIWDENNASRSNVDLMSERNGENGDGELEAEASCNSFTERGEMGFGSNVMHKKNVKEGRPDIKGNKHVASKKAKLGLRRRNRGPADHARFSSVSSHDPVLSDSAAFSCSPANYTQMVNESGEISTSPFISRGSEDSLVHLDFLGEFSHDYESNELVDEDADASPFQGLKCKRRDELCTDYDEKNKIRVLEKALEEEHAARAALYIELEKERSAAASAADEAMAMILRLQEEKASIEMDARQYQRMIEEKSAYDLEEMNLLKEILLRREREKHFLERAVENYRQLFFGSELLDSDVQDIGITNGKRPSSLLSSTEDPMHMLHRINGSTGEKQEVEKANKFSESKVKSIELQDHVLASGRGLPIPEADEVVSLKEVGFHEDPNINNQDDHFPGSYEINGGSEKEFLPCKNLSITKGYNLCDKTVASIQELKPQGDSIGEGFASKTIESCEPEFITPHGCDNSEKHEKDLHGMTFDDGPCVHDVHIIEDKCNVCSEVSENGSVKLLGSPQICDSPTVSRLALEFDINRSRSDTTNGLPPLGCLLSALRRNSMSAVDFERFKIDNEVGWLQERLRLIQEGREKLNISIGNREKEKIQLQLLENILSHLRDDRLLTDSGKAVRQASLPPLFSKDTSKKRRWRSVSLGVHRSS